MTRFFALFAFAVLMPSSLVSAQSSSPILVELFASQNCAACPKAHRTLQSVASENDDVLILTWSVDYWDYLGEADPMALPAAKARQEAYAENLGLRAPYTPQSIYDGTKQCPATRRKTVDRNIDARRALKSSSPARLIQKGRMIEVADGCETPMDVTLVEYLPAAAHQTKMVNPVVGSRKLGDCTSEQTEFEAMCEQSCAVLLQTPGYGEIHAVLALN